jgi:hypothetical protein
MMDIEKLTDEDIGGKSKEIQMSGPDNQSWGNAPISIFTLLLVIFLIWALSGDRHFFSRTGHDLKTAVHDAGQDLKHSVE